MVDSIQNRIFLSYAREDIDKVLKIYEGLKKRNLNPWFDKEYLRTGRWKQTIIKAIAQSRYFVICISQAALKKTGDEPGFQDEELNTAYGIAQEQPDSNFTIVPVRLEDCHRWDFRFASFQYYDLYDDFEGGLDKLAVALGGISLTDPGTRDERTNIEKRLERPMGRAIAAFYARNYEKAISILDTILDIKPEFVPAWINKGSSLEISGNYEEALLVSEKANDLRPDFYIIWYNKGVALIKLGRHKEALPVFDKVTKLRPDFSEAWCNKGSALAGLNRHKEALLAFDKALELKPDLSIAWFNKGNSLRELWLHEEALIAFGEALKLDPDYHGAWLGAWLNKGASLASLNRHDEALEAFNTSLELEPNELMALYNKARALDELGRHSESEVAKKQFLELAKHIS